jgi:hypothetical protein
MFMRAPLDSVWNIVRRSSFAEPIARFAAHGRDARRLPIVAPHRRRPTTTTRATRIIIGACWTIDPGAVMDAEETVALLRDIRDQQRLQLERQSEALAMQREHYEIAKRQFDRAELLQERAEQLQMRSAGVVAFARKLLWVVLPLILFLVLILFWMLFR